MWAKCPRCNKFLTLDEMGCATCRHCDKEFEERYDSTFDAIEKYVEEVSLKIVEADYELLILRKGASKIINQALHKGENIKGV